MYSKHIVKNSVFSCLPAIAVGLLAVAGSAACVSATTTVISTTVMGHSSLVASGSDNKNFWGKGNGSSVQYSGFGASAYSQQTGGEISPFDLNVRNAHTSIFVANLMPGGHSITIPVSGGVLTQVGKNQVYVADTFDIGTPSPTYFSSPSPVSGSYDQIINYGHFLYPMQGLSYSSKQGTSTITVPTPEPTSVLLFMSGIAGLMLVTRKRRLLAR